MIKILLVDDDATLRMTVRFCLESAGHLVHEANDGMEALETIKANSDFDAVLLDVNMPGMSGIETLGAIKAINPKIFCLIMTAYSNVNDAIEAIKLGAYDYLEKPVEPGRILKLIDQAVEAKKMIEIAGQSAPNAPTLDFGEGRNMIGNSTSIKKIFDIIYKLAKVDTSVLIRGESGTGKELVARALHFNSHRKRGPFIAVNCAAIPENLIESELFGFEKGAFTGADRKKMGKFQYAAGGTIFLDEIGDMSLPMQVKLLRVLQDKTFTPVGANQDVTSDVRIIAATSRPLEEMIKSGSFRPDLFYRLNILPIMLPALRDRIEDIPALSEFMVKKFNRIHNREVNAIDPRTVDALKKYSWPGNIRELENVIERSFIVESGDRLKVDSLPEHIQLLALEKSDPFSSTSEAEEEAVALALDPGNFLDNADAGLSNEELASELNFPALKERFEREFIMRALKAFRGRINQTAAHTQMTKVTLLRKLEKYGIDPRTYRQPY